MRVFDCFIFNDELEIIDIRFHTLDKFTSKFVIVESNRTHQGGEKMLISILNILKNLKKKLVIY
jgi:beta-1,4-mannosyl-glycoprotein beta-1,4-N-acetylglucosaminyltransferase